MAGGPKVKIMEHWFGVSQIDVLKAMAPYARQEKKLTVIEIMALNPALTRVSVQRTLTALGFKLGGVGSRYCLGKRFLKEMESMDL